MTFNTQLSLDGIRKLLNESHKQCLVGYGLSEECGVPTFEDQLRGVWSAPSVNWNPFLSESVQERVLSLLRWKKYIIQSRRNAAPYQMLSLLQECLKLDVATQCVDGLIGLNGVKHPVELFGNVLSNRCHVCSELSPHASNIDTPTCIQCGGICWPDIAMFAWNDHREFQEAWRQQLPKNALLLQIGTDPLLMPYGNVPSGKGLQCRVLELTVNKFRYVTENGDISTLKYEDVLKAVKKQAPQPASIPMPPAESGLSIGMYCLLWLAKNDH
jgi:NAD-dependent SIR2 family protein deacetylase